MKTLFKNTALTLALVAGIGLSAWSNVINFYANANGDKVDIMWEVQQLDEQATYIVEKSRRGKRFKEVAEVKAEAATGTVDYFDVDNRPFRGTSFYRLKTVHSNGEITYSNIIPVDFSKRKEELEPCQSVKGQDVLVVLRNSFGEEYYSKVYINQIRPEIKALDLENRIPKGGYLIIATSNDDLYSKQLRIE